MFAHKNRDRWRWIVVSEALSLVLLNIVPAYAELDARRCAGQYANFRSSVAAVGAKTLSENLNFSEIRAARSQISSAPLAAGEALGLKARVTRQRAYLQRFIEPQFDSSSSASTLGFSSKFSVLAEDERGIPAAELMKSQQDWYRGVHYVDSNAEGKPLSVDLLKEIHRRACENMSFRGYEGRRIAKRYRDGEISETEFRALLKRAYSDESVSGIDHRSLVGEIRKDPIDQLSHRGNQTDSTGRRYMTDDEFNGLSRNPLLELVAGSVRREPDGKIRAEFRYVDVAKVEATVQSVIGRTEKSLSAATSIEEKVRAVATMQRDLLSAHPFLDGNGRTVRLLADLMYQRLGLPHPARPNEHDLEMSIDESVTFIRKQMIRTLKIQTGELEL